ncbi:MAG: glycosyltransferase family 4 protein [Clostridiales bacterium]|jgi:glycosyltransferase involved in cell wall biosynthesis|nr:glycosyltransferase family 4 protein [Clostridiales bacterium]
MKILVICQYYYPEPFRITDICKSLIDRGHKVTVLTGLPNYPEGKIYGDYRGHNRRHEMLNGVEVIRTFEIGRRHGALWRFVNYYSFAISSWLKVRQLDNDYDVVFVNQLSPVMMTYAAIKYKKSRSKPLVLYCLDLWPASLSAAGMSKTSFMYKLFRKVSANIYKQADKLLVTSAGFAEYLEDLGVKTARITHLPQYAEDVFRPAQRRRDDGKFNLVFAGNIGVLQSVETIVEAAKRLHNAGLPKTPIFHIVGGGTHLDTCMKAANGLDNIVFYGRRPLEDMPMFYDKADAFLLTLSDDEDISRTLPGKAQSYMAAGKPIIGAANGETAGVIDAANCGYCANAEDAHGLAECIVKLIEKGNCDELGNNALEYYMRNYSKDTFMNKLESCLKYAADRSNK